jgi:hypothetical protein
MSRMKGKLYGRSGLGEPFQSERAASWEVPKNLLLWGFRGAGFLTERP